MRLKRRAVDRQYAEGDRSRGKAQENQHPRWPQRPSSSRSGGDRPPARVVRRSRGEPPHGSIGSALSRSAFAQWCRHCSRPPLLGHCNCVKFLFLAQAKKATVKATTMNDHAAMLVGVSGEPHPAALRRLPDDLGRQIGRAHAVRRAHPPHDVCRSRRGTTSVWSRGFQGRRLQVLRALRAGRIPIPSATRI